MQGREGRETDESGRIQGREGRETDESGRMQGREGRETDETDVLLERVASLQQVQNVT